MLYAYCKERGVGCKRLGKLIVAPSDGDLDRLKEIRSQAAKNGVTDLSFLSADEVSELGREVECAGALLSPSMGIVDSHELMTALQGEIEGQGGALLPGKNSRPRFAKGHYFAYQSKSPFTRLVYPLPTDGGLGIHATNDMSGAVRFGPDVEWVHDSGGV